MTTKRLANFRLEEDILDALARVKERVGIPLSEQARRAFKLWLEQQGESVGPKERPRKRAKR